MLGLGIVTGFINLEELECSGVLYVLAGTVAGSHPCSDGSLVVYPMRSATAPLAKITENIYHLATKNCELRMMHNEKLEFVRTLL